MLLTIDEARARLEEALRDAPFDLTEFLLPSPGLSQGEIAQLERDLGIRLPPSLRKAFELYDLAGMTIGSVGFTSPEGTARYLIEWNVDPELEWWGDNNRPADRFLIASSDGYAILANHKDGTIFAFHHGETVESGEVIAVELELFIRGLATAYLGGLLSAAEVAADVGAQSEKYFWRQFAARRG